VKNNPNIIPFAAIMMIAIIITIFVINYFADEIDGVNPAEIQPEGDARITKLENDIIDIKQQLRELKQQSEITKERMHELDLLFHGTIFQQVVKEILIDEVRTYPELHFKDNCEEGECPDEIPKD
jgi:hypothetical protein